MAVTWWVMGQAKQVSTEGSESKALRFVQECSLQYPASGVYKHQKTSYTSPQLSPTGGITIAPRWRKHLLPGLGETMRFPRGHRSPTEHPWPCCERR